MNNSNTYKPHIAIIITVNDIENFHGGSKEGIKRRISYFDQFLILYQSIKEKWISNHFSYKMYLLHSIEFSNKKREILRSIDVKTILVNYPQHTTKIRPMAYYQDIECDFRLVLDVDMLAMGNPTFNFNCDFQAMYGGNKYNEEQWFEICRYLDCNFPNYPILKKEKGNYKSWSVEEITLYQKGKINERLFPYFNNGAILIKNAISIDFVKKWEVSRELFTKYVKENFNLEIDMEGQDIVGIVLNNTSSNWMPFEIGFNYPLQESFSNSKSLLDVKNESLSLVHYINIKDNFRCSNIIYKKYLKVQRQYYGISIFQIIREYIKFLKDYL